MREERDKGQNEKSCGIWQMESMADKDAKKEERLDEGKKRGTIDC